MTTITFLVTVEIMDEQNLFETQIDQTLSDLENLLMKHPIGYDLYNSEWFYED